VARGKNSLPGTRKLKSPTSRHLFLIPAAVFGLLSIGLPLVLLVVQSMQHFSIFGWEWIGLDHYRKILADPELWRTVWNTFLYMAFLVPSVTIGSLMIALGIRDHPRQAYLRFVLFAPSLTAGAIVANFWRYFYSPEGPANLILNAIGMTAQPWLIYGGPSVLAISIVLWTSLVGSITMIYSAALSGISSEMLEAAAVDGASRRQVNWRVIVPNLLPTVSLIALLTTIVAWQALETILMLAPATYAGNVMFRMFQVGFSYGRHGEGSAIAVFILVVVTVLAALKQRLEKRNEH